MQVLGTRPESQTICPSSTSTYYSLLKHRSSMRSTWDFLCHYIQEGLKIMSSKRPFHLGKLHMSSKRLFHLGKVHNLSKQ